MFKFILLSITNSHLVPNPNVFHSSSERKDIINETWEIPVPPLKVNTSPNTLIQNIHKPL